MRSFICKVQGGRIVPLVPSQDRMYKKLLNDAQQWDKTIIVTIEEPQKILTPKQVKFYQAYIIKASQYIGITYKEMEKELFRFFPRDVEQNKPKAVTEWTTKELEQFMQTADVVLGQLGFKFE